ncbi:MAG: response regulator transcription factor [Bacteriovorax sp.]|nr:response regulator transcription factor [Bacteriovorax sp.]
MNILFIEDDYKLSSFVSNGLAMEGFDIDHAADGEIGLNKINNSIYDLIILDMMLPKVDGSSILAHLQTKTNPPPVLILSAKESVADRVKGLRDGGDDYLVKPFSFTELLARVEVLIRRNQRHTRTVNLNFEDIHINLDTRETKRGDMKIELHPREFTLLHFLMSQPEIVVTKSQILEKAWGYNFDPQTNVVDVLVCRLRNKIDKDFEVKTIHTIRGVGYVLKKG